MTELFLVRHGETEWSRNGRHTSVTDLALTERGEQQARALRSKLDPAEFGLVLSSPRRRAQQTAELAGFTADHAPQIEDGLVEWAYGDYEGLTIPQIREQNPKWTIWVGPTPGGETAQEVSARLNSVIARVRESGADQALCFAHGHSLRALMLCWLGLDLSLGGQFPLDTGTVSVLGEAKGRPALVRWNADT